MQLDVEYDNKRAMTKYITELDKNFFLNERDELEDTEREFASPRNGISPKIGRGTQYSFDESS